MRPRVHWDAETGWVIDTPVALGKLELQKCIDFTRKVQLDRAKSKPAEVREQMLQALKHLSLATLKMNLLPESGFSGGERVLYKR